MIYQSLTIYFIASHRLVLPAAAAAAPAGSPWPCVAGLGDAATALPGSLHGADGGGMDRTRLNAKWKPCGA
jgi:hypothetical protein